MIVNFAVKNFRSIRDLQVLAMNAARIVSKEKELDATNLIDISPKLKLIKSKAIYGANASGKSTMMRALSAFVHIAIQSVKEDSSLKKWIDSFNLSDNDPLEPTYFQLTFIYNEILYRYGYEANANEIKSEWLFGTPGKKEVPFFTREGNDIKVNINQFEEGAKVIDLYKQSDNDIARPNSLFLTTVRSFNQGLARQLIDYFSRYIIISGLADKKMRLITHQFMEQEPMRLKIVELLKLADVGIDDIQRQEFSPEDAPPSADDRYFTLTSHKRFDKDGKPSGQVLFEMVTGESQGTQKMFEISIALLQSLEEGRVLIMDEFDARFHPLLSRRIVELYNSASNKKAQLIYATNDTNLLNPQLLRRDQICFVEKDKQGASHFYSLVDFKGVRNDASFEKDYVAGKYGAIPFLGDFTSLIED